MATGQAMECFAIFNANLKPGQNTTVVAPGSANLYTATLPGTTNANVTFSYNIGNTSQNTVSKLYTFDISENAPTGTYTASATAAKSGYLSGSGSETFTVSSSTTHSGSRLG